MDCQEDGLGLQEADLGRCATKFFKGHVAGDDRTFLIRVHLDAQFIHRVVKRQ